MSNISLSSLNYVKCPLYKQTSVEASPAAEALAHKLSAPRCKATEELGLELGSSSRRL